METYVRLTIDDASCIHIDNKDTDDRELRLEENIAKVLVLQWSEGVSGVLRADSDALSSPLSRSIYDLPLVVILVEDKGRDASSYLILEEEHARSGAKREATRSRDSVITHGSPKLRKLIISNLNSNLWAKPDLNRIVDRLSGSALKLEEDYELVRVEQEEEGWAPFSYKPKQPLSKHLFEESLLSSLDPRIVSSYKKALSY
ncbi:hypothetical protein IGI04_026551 [Brassica rapa subsp. trilocularis]|uniref:Uncharacterized protein n=1 Tax=Brassica rapa subsp. trilocularis TaxID=1813537 RepID=A0ABQ7KWL9_BRACM|nr:hypothetical protein IGI04_026551 [Brassica rapa subsp. trilocularis]